MHSNTFQNSTSSWSDVCYTFGIHASYWGIYHLCSQQEIKCHISDSETASKKVTKELSRCLLRIIKLMHFNLVTVFFCLLCYRIQYWVQAPGNKQVTHLKIRLNCLKSQPLDVNIEGPLVQGWLTATQHTFLTHILWFYEPVSLFSFWAWIEELGPYINLYFVFSLKKNWNTHEQNQSHGNCSTSSSPRPTQWLMICDKVFDL